MPEQKAESLTQAVLNGLRKATQDEMGCGCAHCQFIAISVSTEVSRFLSQRPKHGGAWMRGFINENSIGPACLIAIGSIVLVTLIITGIIK